MIHWHKLTFDLSMILVFLSFGGVVFSAFANPPACTYTLETKPGEHILRQDCNGVVHVQRFTAGDLR